NPADFRARLSAFPDRPAYTLHERQSRRTFCGPILSQDMGIGAFARPRKLCSVRRGSSTSAVSLDLNGRSFLRDHSTIGLDFPFGNTTPKLAYCESTLAFA